MNHFANFASQVPASELKLRGGNNVTYENNEYIIGTPTESSRKNKKYQVDVLNNTTGKNKTVHWGSPQYDDWYVHQDEKRRENFLRRASGIRTKDGKLAGENPMSPAYHSIYHSWNKSVNHFANFIRLTDANINKTRSLISSAKSGDLNTGWAGLSGFNPKNPAAVHDNLQHRLVDKTIYKAATGEDPNQYFRQGSLQQKTKMMPLTQGKNISKEKHDLVNETVEKLVETSSIPYSYMRQNYEPDEILPIDTRPILPLVRRKFSSADRLAGMQISNNIFTKNQTITNDGFRQKYIEAMQEDAPLRKPMDIRLKSESKKLKTPAAKLRAKMQDRQNYADAFDTSKYEDVDQYIDRNRILDAYRAKGLMAR